MSLTPIALDAAGGAEDLVAAINTFIEVAGEVPDYTESNPNLFDAADPSNIMSTIYNTDTDSYAASGSRLDTHPIPVEEGEQYYISHALSLALPYRPRFLDSQGNIVYLETGSQECPAGWIFSVPVDLEIETLRFSTHIATINEFEIRKIVKTKELATGLNFTGKSALFLGDSITAQQSWTKLVVDKMAMNTVANKAVSGQRASQGVDQLLSTEVLAADIIFIAFGTNDHNQNISVGTSGSIPSSDNFSGHLRDLAETIYGIKPTVRIMFLTPPHNAGSRTVNSASADMKAYSDMVKEVGAQYSIPVCDVFGESGISPENVSELTQDNTHPNRLGGERIASLVIKKLKSL